MNSEQSGAAIIPLALEDQPTTGLSRPEKFSKTIFPFAELILHVRIPQWTVDMAGGALLKRTV